MKEISILTLLFVLFNYVKYPSKNNSTVESFKQELIEAQICDQFGILYTGEENHKSSKKLIFVRGGVYMMGNKRGDYDEKPVHKVHVKSFYMSRFEITNAQYSKFLNHYKSDKVKNGKFAGRTMIYSNEFGLVKRGGKWFPQTGFERHPVVFVTWYGANEFCKFLKCRLPSEAEWEYAARGGSNSRQYKFCGANKPDEVAWYYKNSYQETHPVAKKRPNELNIFDLSGNVWEWCADTYDENYYQNSPTFNPKGPKDGQFRSARGGSYISSQSNLRCTDRVRAKPDDKSIAFGFRFVKSIEKEPTK